MDRVLSTPATSGVKGQLFSVPAKYVWINAETREVRFGRGEELHLGSPDELACAHQLPAVAALLTALDGDAGAVLADMGQERSALLSLRAKMESDGRALAERTAAVANLEAERRQSWIERNGDLARREEAALRREREAEAVIAEYERRLSAAETARAEAVAERQGLLRVMAAAGHPVSR